MVFDKAEALIKSSELATLASIDESGYPRIATMCSLKTEGINTIWFSTGTHSHKVNNFIKNPKSSVSYCLNTSVFFTETLI